MKSKDDKSEDGSDQERECLECDCHSLTPPARSVHVLVHIYCVLRVFSRHMYPPIFIPCDLTAELRIYSSPSSLRPQSSQSMGSIFINNLQFIIYTFCSKVGKFEDVIAQTVTLARFFFFVVYTSKVNFFYLFHNHIGILFYMFKISDSYN